MGFAPITNGELDQGDLSVVALLRNGEVFCTGTLVTPNVIVTAAHCIGEREVRVLFGTSATEHDAICSIADQRAHPDFDRIELHNDIGVLLLSDPAPSWITPVPLRLESLPFDVVGAELRIVGFGLTAVGPGAESGSKHVGETTLRSVAPRSFDFGPNPSGTCMGDSGGPAFMSFDGVETLVGVTSSGDARCEEYGRDTRVDAYAEDFVLPYIAMTSKQGIAIGERCFLPDNCASGTCTHPEDAPAIGYCNAPCESDNDCPVAMTCDASSSTCRYTTSPGALGTDCSMDSDCDSGMCAPVRDGGELVCTSTCLPQIAETCPDHAVCVASGSAHLCVPEFEEAGCTIAGGGASFGCVLLIVWLVGQRVRRPRHRRC